MNFLRFLRALIKAKRKKKRSCRELRQFQVRFKPGINLDTPFSKNPASDTLQLLYVLWCFKTLN